jgi:hypothetical protein
MRSKALLVGAQAGFTGPWVNIEEGAWVVGPCLSSISLETNGATLVPGDLNMYQVYGPGKVRASIQESYAGDDVFLKICQDD